MWFHLDYWISNFGLQVTLTGEHPQLEFSGINVFGYMSVSLLCPAKSTLATNVANFLLTGAFCRDFFSPLIDLQNYRIFTGFTECRRLLIGTEKRSATVHTSVADLSSYTLIYTILILYFHQEKIDSTVC
jgi:hypothetical protein